MVYGASLYWLPLGAGGHSVRLNGRAYEAVVAAIHCRERRDLYHSAVVVDAPEGRFVIEQAPIPEGRGCERDVVGEGGSSARGSLRA
jgi:hypothetical protein